MPKATTLVEPQRYELRSLPGAFVLLRKLSYGEFLHRQDLALQVGAKQSRGGDTDLLLKAAQTAVTHWEFRTCILDHNLEDETGRKLNFHNLEDFQRLDPIVGQEIGRYIDELTQLSDRDTFPEASREDSTISEA